MPAGFAIAAVDRVELLRRGLTRKRTRLVGLAIRPLRLDADGRWTGAPPAWEPDGPEEPVTRT